MLRAMIVDDEQPAREELAELLADVENLTVVGECSNALEAIAAIHRLQPDVVFLDIQMPRISGLEMTAMLDPATMPHIVFTTAYDEYAVKAFEQHAFDYLLKPVDGQRLLKTIERLRGARSVNRNVHLIADNALKHIPCYGHNRIFLLRLDDVEYLSSELSGVRVIGTEQSGYTQLTLKILEEKTPFTRCHRQYLLNLDHIGEIQLLDNGSAEAVTRSGKRIPVSRRYLKPLKEQLGIA
ncbi:DNA-binding response regulator [Leminorella grimontii]|uniref:DNA-binding response regulator n=1 Tax=Leminorella grimontii TaxID=82981 RepID=A0AAV5N3Y2_9GAMM|nr:two-component system response regulator BtsR [Leminorella grimontii]GKX55112.1 DNA-binding response regulator [Leminorella grimontii]VFS56892.1 Probable transcriptional regulatory protein YehT [Leminorella grimontii]